jgi:hypothetical protein
MAKERFLNVLYSTLELFRDNMAKEQFFKVLDSALDRKSDKKLDRALDEALDDKDEKEAISILENASAREVNSILMAKGRSWSGPRVLNKATSLCVYNGYDSLLRKLFSKVADEQKKEIADSIFCEALSFHNTKILKTIIEQYEDGNFKHVCQGALYHAATFCDIEMFMFLLREGEKFNIKEQMLTHPELLRGAVWGGNLALVRFILEQYEKEGVYRVIGDDALSLAVKNKCVDTLAYMLNRRRDKAPALKFVVRGAMRTINFEFLRSLLNKIDDKEVKVAALSAESDYNDPLLITAKFRSFEGVHFLLQQYKALNIELNAKLLGRCVESPVGNNNIMLFIIEAIELAKKNPAFDLNLVLGSIQPRTRGLICGIEDETVIVTNQQIIDKITPQIDNILAFADWRVDNSGKTSFGRDLRGKLNEPSKFDMVFCEEGKKTEKGNASIILANLYRGWQEKNNTLLEDDRSQKVTTITDLPLDALNSLVAILLGAKHSDVELFGNAFLKKVTLDSPSSVAVCENPERQKWADTVIRPQAKQGERHLGF